MDARPHQAGVPVSEANSRLRRRHALRPEMNGFKRPWHVGVLWNDDQRLPQPLLDELRPDASLVGGGHDAPLSAARAVRIYAHRPRPAAGAAPLLAGSAAGPDRHV